MIFNFWYKYGQNVEKSLKFLDTLTKLRLSKIGKLMLSEQIARKHCPMHSMKHFQVLLTRDNILTKLHAEHVPKTFSAGLLSFRIFSIESNSL